MRMNRLGIEQLSVFGLPPVEFVTLAADLGCDAISTGLTGFGFNPHHYAALRREMTAAMRDRGIAISLGEGCNIRADADIRDCGADMDIMAELGTEAVNTVSLDPDLHRTLDQLAIFAEMAAARGMVSTIELCPVLVISDLDRAADAVRHVGRPDFRLLLDTMHLGRSGATVEALLTLESASVGYCQLCDAPGVPIENNYMLEATYERKVPGTGDLPLAGYLKAIPDDVVVSLEIPMRSRAEAGIGPMDRLRPAVAAARALLAGRPW
jgi:sugar phosphate isomerase/epimerase